MDVKFLHATVLTQNGQREVLDDGGVAVSRGRIAAVGKSADIERAHAALPTIDLSGKALRDAIAATKDFPGVAGKITINEKRDAEKQAVVLKVEDGKTKFVATVKP